MHLVQLLLPIFDNSGHRLPRRNFSEVAAELAELYGGLTAYTRSPAEGLWKENPQQTSRDDIVIYEVMVETLDVVWWRNYRARLEQRFRQQLVVVRTHQIQLL